MVVPAFEADRWKGGMYMNDLFVVSDIAEAISITMVHPNHRRGSDLPE